MSLNTSHIMLAKNWLNFSTFLMSTGLAKEMPEDEFEKICPCVTRNSENKSDHGAENLKLLQLYANFTPVENLMRLPNVKTIALDQTIFKLFRRTGPPDGTRIYADDVETLKSGGYDVGIPTVVATHGYLSDASNDWMMQLKTAQLEALDCNYISIDWSKCSSNCCYFGARDCSLAVGGYLRSLLISLVEMGADPAQFHLIGHSLGAHLISQVSNDGLLVGRMTGLDPPHLGFDMDEPHNRIDPDDAVLVDIIHSSSSLGWNKVLGKWDFFPNSAGLQPGCSVFNPVCSHSMSHDYYIESLADKKKYPSHKCPNLKKALKGDCDGETAYMGVLATDGSPGIYYIKL